MADRTTDGTPPVTVCAVTTAPVSGASVPATVKVPEIDPVSSRS